MFNSISIFSARAMETKELKGNLKLSLTQFDKGQLPDLSSPTMGCSKIVAMNAHSVSPTEKQIIIVLLSVSFPKFILWAHRVSE